MQDYTQPPGGAQEVGAVAGRPVDLIEYPYVAAQGASRKYYLEYWQGARAACVKRGRFPGGLSVFDRVGGRRDRIREFSAPARARLRRKLGMIRDDAWDTSLF